MNPSDMASEYANIKNYCRKEAAKSFKHPLAPKPAEQAQPDEEQAEKAAGDLSDEELEAMLGEE
jgi:hypothetical protein